MESEIVLVDGRFRRRRILQQETRRSWIVSLSILVSVVAIGVALVAVMARASRVVQLEPGAPAFELEDGSGSRFVVRVPECRDDDCHLVIEWHRDDRVHRAELHMAEESAEPPPIQESAEEEEPEPDEAGVASWYGPGFHGRCTANGEIYDMYGISAAHKSLAFGTRVRVSNLDNGNSLVVRINDRGPFIDGRIIDLSRGAAEWIGMAEAGVAAVEIAVVEDAPVRESRRESRCIA